MQVSLDWSDPDLLKELVKRRLVANVQLRDGKELFPMWRRLFVSHYEGEDALDRLIRLSLMRPRNLLKLLGYCRGFAVNLNHQRVEEDDLAKGIAAYSRDLLLEADRELRDVAPDAYKLLYEFVGEGTAFTQDEMSVLLELTLVPRENHDATIRILRALTAFWASKGRGSRSLHLRRELRHRTSFGPDQEVAPVRSVHHQSGILAILGTS